MSLDPERHEVVIRGDQVTLPLKEFELLGLLLENAGRVLTRETLIDRVWGADYVGDTKTLDVHIKRLRAKVETDPSQPDPDRHDPGPRLQVRAPAPGRPPPPRSSTPPSTGSTVGRRWQAPGLAAGGRWPPARREGDPSLAVSAFTRLARVHALSTAVDTLVATSLAGSLFFSIPTGEARGRVALYLLLTIAPFAVVGPVMGPALDRMPGGRRLLVIGTGVARVVVCLAHVAARRQPAAVPRGVRHPRAGQGVRHRPQRPGAHRGQRRRRAGRGQLQAVAARAACAASSPPPPARWCSSWSAPSGCWCWPRSSPSPRPSPPSGCRAVQVAAEPPGAAEQEELRSDRVVLASEAMGLLRGVGRLPHVPARVRPAWRRRRHARCRSASRSAGRVRDAAGFELAPASGAGGSSPTWHFGVVLGASVLGSLIGALLAPRLRDAMSRGADPAGRARRHRHRRGRRRRLRRPRRRARCIALRSSASAPAPGSWRSTRSSSATRPTPTAAARSPASRPGSSCSG